MNKLRLASTLFFANIFLLLSGTATQSAVKDNMHEKEIRDSIFQELHSLPLDSTRLDRTSKLFQYYIGCDWSVELADSGLSDALKLNNPEQEMNFRYDLLRYAHMRGNLKQTEQYMKAIKEPAYRYQMYDDYFTALRGYLSLLCAKGDIEHVLRKAQWMQQESLRLNCTSCQQISYLTLINANRYAGNNDLAIYYCHKTLNMADISTTTKLTLYSYLSQIYYKLKKYEKNKEVLDKQYAILDSLVKISPINYVNYKNRFLENALGHCKIRIEQKNPGELKKYLDEAGKHYDEGAYFSYYISYHDYRAAYYAMIQDWANCRNELNIALARCDGRQPLRELEIRFNQAKYLFEAGNKAEAVSAYENVALSLDSLLTNIRQKQKETVVGNYVIQKSLLDKQENEKSINLISVLIGILIFLFLIGTVIYQLFYHRRLHRMDAETRTATLQIRQANKMKEVFLKNIIKQVQPPLNSVVHLSRQLSANENLPQELRNTYSRCIKESTTQLIELINNILDLSRLEAGMMRFNIQPCEVLQLCKDAINIVKMKNPGQTTINFQTDITNDFALFTDSERFLKMLTSLLSTSKDGPISMQLTKNESCIIWAITGTPLANQSICEQQNILNEINRLFIETFGGNYNIDRENEKVIITLLPNKTSKKE